MVSLSILRFHIKNFSLLSSVHKLKYNIFSRQTAIIFSKTKLTSYVILKLPTTDDLINYSYNGVFERYYFQLYFCHTIPFLMKIFFGFKTARKCYIRPIFSSK